MKTSKTLLILAFSFSMQVLFAQVKGEMPFSASPTSNKLLRQAWYAMWDFKIDEGLALYKEVRTKDPDFALAYLDLFGVDAETRKMNMEKAKNLKATADERLLIDAWVARFSNQPVDASVETLVKKYPKDKNLKFNVANLIQVASPDKSKAIYDELIREDKNFSAVYNLLGYYYMNRSEMQAAEKNFDKYIALRPDLGNPYDSKAEFLERNGNYEEAAKFYDKAAALGMAVSKPRADRARARIKWPPPSEQDKTAIKNLSNALAAALSDSNIPAGMKLYSDHAIELTPNQRAWVGVANIRKRWTELLSGQTIKMNTVTESVNGVGPIAVYWAKTNYASISKSANQTTESMPYNVRIWRRHTDGDWRILVNHWQFPADEALPLSQEDKTAVRQLLGKWESTLKKGEAFSVQSLDQISNLYSQQVVEVLPNLISNIGMGNLRARFNGFLGIKIESSALRTLGVEGIGRRAVAWGILDHSWYASDATQLTRFEDPWAMILTKENDDIWRILAIHWGQ